jgi:hypothetical protein
MLDLTSTKAFEVDAHRSQRDLHHFPMYSRPFHRYIHCIVEYLEEFRPILEKLFKENFIYT